MVVVLNSRYYLSIQGGRNDPEGGGGMCCCGDLVTLGGGGFGEALSIGGGFVVI